MRPFVEGDSFHRYDRAEMKQKMADALGAATAFSHFGPEANLFAELAALFEVTARPGKVGVAIPP